MNENESTTTENNFGEKITKILSGEKALSYSSLSKLLKSPKHFKEYLTEDIEPTKAMKEGIMFHMACLEPDKFKEKYWVLDDTDKCNEIGGSKPRATKVYKEWLELEINKHEGELIEKDLYDTFLRMSDALRYNITSGKLMKNATNTEQQYFAEYDGFKITYKIDLEGKDDEGEYIADIKKVADADFSKIKWDIPRMNYDLQGGMYSEFKEIKRYFLIYIDMGCNITVVKFTQDTLNAGFSKFEVAIDGFERCAQNNCWNDSYEFWNKGYINY